MKRKRTKKVVLAAVIAVGLTGGTAAAAVAYQSGNGFQPFQSDRGMRANQVVFSESEDVTGHNQDNNNAENDLWEKDQNAEDHNQNQGKAKYLLASDQTELIGDNNSASLNNGDNSVTQNGNGQQSGTVYDITNDKSKADVIIDNGSKPSNNGSNSDNGNNNGNNSSNNGGGSGNNGSNGDDTPNTPVRPDEPDTPDEPSNEIRDPEMTKSNPVIGTDSGKVVSKPYTESAVPAHAIDEDGNDRCIIIEKAYGEKTNILYVGQKIDAKMIFYAMNTYVRGKDNVQYLWGVDAWNKYIRVDSVSFDGGKTWTSKFPVTIPKNMPDNTMQIRFGYRFKTKDAWLQKQVSYEAELNRIYVLNDKVKNNQIQTDNIINYDQTAEIGSKVNLMRYLQEYLGDDDLTELFPGWMENGKLVPWLYTATEGRHILEPADKVPLSDDYEVKLVLQWMSDDYQVGIEYNNLCYLQTLTNFRDNAAAKASYEEDDEAADRVKVSVPKYVQAIVLDSDADLTMDYLEIPDTVLYIAEFGADVNVREGFKVAGKNLFYASTAEGLLTNKDGTEILGIPSKIEEVTVPSYVTKVNLAENSHFPLLTLEADTMDQMPEITYSKLNNCKIMVKENLLEDFMIANYQEIAKGNNNCVASENEPDVTYTVVDHAIVNNEGGMRRALALGNTNLKLSSDVRSICEGAFEKSESITTLTMPRNGERVTLEANCFADSQVKTILCYTMEQYLYEEMQLAQAGAAGDVEVKLLEESQEGYYYATDSNGENAVLIAVPDEIESYDGTVTASDGSAITINAIGDEAFANCQNLKWVMLPESVDTIGYQAFADCSQLQGILIDAKESITIGNKAWDGCTALRFVASNAVNGIMQDDYDPDVSDAYSSELMQNHYFFVPTNAEGYSSNAIHFLESAGVAGFSIRSTGERGRMLYGLDSDGTPWLAIRSGTEVDDQVQLPTTTREIYRYAMADTRAPSGSYTLNQDMLPELRALDGGTFKNSDICGDITLGTDNYIGEECFYGCSGITSLMLEGKNFFIGQDAFFDCSSLTTVDLGELSGNDACLYRGIFTGCNQLTDVTLHNETAPLIVTSGNSQFQFNWYWSLEEEAEKLKIHVPESAWENYAMAWRYLFAGYTGGTTNSAYMEMWQDIQMMHIDWETWEYPPDEEVDVYVEEELLSAENRVRMMIGADQVSEPTDFYPYRQSGDGELTLISTPTYVRNVELTPEVLEMPEGWYLDYVGTGAFSKATQLESVTFQDTLAGIYTNAFEGLSGRGLTLRFEGTTPAKLLGGTKETPFTFGTKENGLSIVVPAGSEKAYVQAWVYPMAGYESLDEVLQSLDAGLSDQEKQEAAAKILMPVENQLRQMLGLSEVTEISDLWCLDAKTDTPAPDETEETKETEETSVSESESETETMPAESETETVESEFETESESETETQETSINDTETSESETEEETMTESKQPEEIESMQEGDI